MARSVWERIARLVTGEAEAKSEEAAERGWRTLAREMAAVYDDAERQGWVMRQMERWARERER